MAESSLELGFQLVESATLTIHDSHHLYLYYLLVWRVLNLSSSILGYGKLFCVYRDHLYSINFFLMSNSLVELEKYKK